MYLCMRVHVCVSKKQKQMPIKSVGYSCNLFRCVSVCTHLLLKQLDESGKVVLILATVSFQITLNNLVASLAHFSLLTVGGSVEQGRKKEGSGIKVQMQRQVKKGKERVGQRNEEKREEE